MRDYQRSLAARLINPGAGSAVSRLGLEIGAERWLVDLADAGEVMPVPPVASVPLTRPWYAGVTNIRGNLYSVVDFPAFLGGAATIGDQTRLVLVGAKYRINCGLLVNRVLGLFRKEQLRPCPSSSPGSAAAPWTATEFSDDGGARWKQLDMRQLVTHLDFLRVGI